MHILHDDNLTVLATFRIIPKEAIAKMRARGDKLIEFHADEHIHHSEIHLSRDEVGKVVASRKARMAIACVSPSATLGEEILFSGVPAGAAISLNGAEIGVMDDSGELSVMAEVAGTHRFVFSLAGHMDQEIVVEVDRAA